MARGWFAEELRAEVKRAIAEIEARTGAEVVVAVRPVSGDYRATDLAVGLGFALLSLCVFLYHPEPFDFTWLPLELALAFLLGALVSRGFEPLRRVLSSKARRQSAADMAARAAFVDLGVHRTRARSGVLVFVSAFERCAVVVADAGIPPSDAWRAWCERVDVAVRSGKPSAFLSALAQCAPLLESAVPRAADDQNELEDGMREVES